VVKNINGEGVGVGVGEERITREERGRALHIYSPTD
jgi:hypothetical protein